MAELATLVRLSGSHFTCTFKVSFRCTPHVYVMRRRIERARDLMLTNTQPLVEVALACGLADQSHFSRLFSSDWKARARLPGAEGSTLTSFIFSHRSLGNDR